MTTTPDLDTLYLDKGSHSSRQKGVCLLEAVAWLAGREHTDHPPCVSPVLGAFGRSFNDYLPDDQRQLLRPFIPRMIGTAGDGKDAARLDIITAWMVHEYAPHWLYLAGLPEPADKLRSLVVPRWPAAAADAADAAAIAAGLFMPVSWLQCCTAHCLPGS
jgi:hypothetical protein